MTDDNARTYQGWSNYGTWAVALWINNEQGWQTQIHEALQTAADEYRDEDCAACDNGETHPTKDYPAHLAGAIIEESVNEDIAFRLTGDPSGDFPASLTTDLLLAAVSEINWTELGASFLTDLDEQ